MTAQDPEEKNLPREPLDLPAGRQDLPKEPLDLPRDPMDLPSPKESSSSSEQNQTQSSFHEIKTVLEWTAPGRPFRRRSRQYYLTSLLLMLLIEVILFLFSQYMLMLVVLSLVFVAFALNTISPSNFKYRISSEGITIEDHFFLWQELYDFYFKKGAGIDVVHVRTHSFIPGELTLTLGDISRDRIKSALLPYLPYREFIKQNFMEKSGQWLEKNFPLENLPR